MKKLIALTLVAVFTLSLSTGCSSNNNNNNNSSDDIYNGDNTAASGYDSLNGDNTAASGNGNNNNGGSDSGDSDSGGSDSGSNAATGGGNNNSENTSAVGGDNTLNQQGSAYQAGPGEQTAGANLSAQIDASPTAPGVAPISSGAALTSSDATYQIGPGRQYAGLAELIAARGNVFQSGEGSLQPGDVVEIYPNIQIIEGVEVNVPYEAETNATKGFLITVSGAAGNPVTIRGIPDEQGRRPILERSAEYLNMVTFNGSYIVFEGFIVDGGLREFIEWLNGNSASGNRFGANSKAAFPGETVTFENFHTFLKRNSASPGGALFPGELETYMREVGERFARRGVFHEGGDFLTVRNCLSVGSGTGLTSADVGPGSILVELCEFAFNGMGGAWHNVYLNGDNAVYRNLTAMFRNNYVHHSIGSMGFRSRVGRTILMNNFFWDNGLRHADLICTQKDEDDFENRWLMYEEIYGTAPPSDWWWADRFAYREDHEVIGNVFVNTAAYNFGGIRLGGAMPEADLDHWMETSLGRYRIVNNTFVHLAGTGVARAAIEAHFGVESIEMYNNIFYSNQPANTAPFWDLLSDARIGAIVGEARAAYAANTGGNAAVDPKWINDDGSRFGDGGYEEENANMWRFGARQVAGANNWVSYGSLNNSMRIDADYQYFGGVPFEWTDTIFGNRDENPFVDIANFNFRLNAASTANRAGSPVGAAVEFMTQAEYDALKSAGRLPLWETYHYDSSGVFIKDIGADRTPAPWQDIGFPDPTAANVSSPPFIPVTGAMGGTWTFETRSDSAAAFLGAYATTGEPAITPAYAQPAQESAPLPASESGSMPTSDSTPMPTPGSAPIIAPEDGIYDISNFYSSSGTLSLSRGDVIIVGKRRYRVLADNSTIEYWSMDSMDAAIAWWTDYLDSYVQSGVLAAIQ